MTRRNFIAAATVAGAPAVLTADDTPALLGGTRACTAKFPPWPIFDEREEKAVTEVVRSGAWGRGSGKKVAEFEAAWTKMTGAKGCVTTVNGTNALFTSLNVAGVQAGDEVLVTPFTFIATINIIVRQHALPVFVDTDIESFLIDPRKLEAAITPRTKAIIPVHIAGSSPDMDGVMAVARKHKLVVIEDAAQAWVTQWKGRHAGLTGDCGCFSFQASKNINSGEGGAIISNNEEFIDRCWSFHNQGRARRGSRGDEFSYQMSGSNLRLTEFQAAILLVQLSRLEEQSKKRSENAAYLASLLKEIPGIRPAKIYDGCTRHSYHLFMIHYDKDKFAGMPRSKFLKALGAEGVGFSAGYSSHTKIGFLRNLPQSRSYRALYSAARLAEWEKQSFNMPVNERVCDEHAWCSQRILLGDRSAMDQIAEGFRKVQKNAARLAKA